MKKVDKKIYKTEVTIPIISNQIVNFKVAAKTISGAKSQIIKLIEDYKSKGLIDGNFDKIVYSTPRLNEEEETKINYIERVRNV